MKKTIKIKFVDFWAGFNNSDNDFIDVLSKKYDVQLSNDPEYLFFSCFGYEHLKYKCIRIFFTGECYTPNFNEVDYAIAYDRLNFGDRYLRQPLYSLFQYRPDYLALRNRNEFTQDDLDSKKGFCSFVYSNCFAQDLRTQIFEKLCTYKKVSSGGRYRNNVGGAVKDKKGFQSKYKFAIAFENSSYDGYCTEKIMEAFAAGCIPIYYGDPNVVKDFNPASFINVHNYESLDNVVDIVKEIDCDNELYLSIRNANPLKNIDTNNQLADFLYHIVNQEYSRAFRRPFAAHPRSREAAQLRYAFFETKIYAVYQKIKNQLVRLKTGTMLTPRKTR